MQSQGVYEDRSYAPEAEPIGPPPTPEEERTIRNATEIFTRCLQTEWTRQKAPYGFDDALDRARSAGKDTTERIFVDAGDGAWLAYYLIVGITRSHFPGKPSEDRTISAFQGLPSEHRRRVAASVANCDPHSSVISAIERLKEPTRRRKRRCLGRDEIPTTAVPNTSFLTLQSPTMRTTPPENTLARDSPAARHETNSTSASNETVNLPMAISGSEHQRASDPCIEYIADVFPQFMCSAIRKNGNSAAVEMVFPYFHDNRIVDCAMSLGILPNKIEYLALKLFGWHLETDEREIFRYIVSENDGGIAMPGETMVLQGARDNAISDLLGDQIRDAIIASLMRKEEVRQAVRNTRCVTMQISRNPREDAVLTLNVALREGFTLREKLYERK
ncbi:hypothetical protein CEP54_015108 [Fusarium duplospermum]|uniref:Uncharacterized protein n=1 Tax=Fusarium duplospermum TaxID=1325734 RepID=A0A428NRG7_9HYPO|nr:hypothetical protein CEP54_015108 [Fusarium duplospermum]